MGHVTFCVREGSPSCLRVLFEAGAVPDEWLEEGAPTPMESLLTSPMPRCAYQMLKVFLDHGFDVSSSRCRIQHGQGTPLEYALEEYEKWGYDYDAIPVLQELLERTHKTRVTAGIREHAKRVLLKLIQEEEEAAMEAEM